MKFVKRNGEAVYALKEFRDFRSETFQMVEFDDIDFSDVVFKKSVFKNCDFKNVNLNDTNFNFSNFYECNFEKCTFRNSQCWKMRMEKCFFKGCDFNDSYLQDIKIYDSLIEDSSFDFCNLDDGHFFNTSVINTNFSCACVRELTFGQCTIKNVSFYGAADWAHIELSTAKQEKVTYPEKRNNWQDYWDKCRSVGKM